MQFLTRHTYRIVSFADVGAKDVTDFLAWYPASDLVKRIGTDWVDLPRRVYIDEYEDDKAVI
jgi:hypothetical protein